MRSFSVSTPICTCGESRLLVSWCAGDRCDLACSDEDRDRSRRPGAEDWGWLSTGWVLGGQTIERLGDTMCSLHRAQGDKERGFLGLASKPRSTVSPSLASNPVAMHFPILASKLAAMVW
jgi:hypothetical protein